MDLDRSERLLSLQELRRRLLDMMGAARKLTEFGHEKIVFILIFGFKHFLRSITCLPTGSKYLQTRVRIAFA